MRDARVLLSVLVLVAACGDNTSKGADGEDGANAVVNTTAEPAGENCSAGGTRIDAGVDTNGDGVLDPSEVTSTSYVCTGGGQSSLVTTTVEAAGANCPFGGTRIDSGVDANNNGTLDASEINAPATTYVCNGSPAGSVSPSTGLVIAYRPNGISTSPTAPISVRFQLKDDRGFPVDIKGVYSLNTVIAPRFSLSYVTTTAGIVSPLRVYTKSGSSQSPTSYSPTSNGQGTLVENGVNAGDYTYTFPTTSITNGPAAVVYDTTKLDETHVVWIQASRQTDTAFSANANTYFAANEAHYYIPSGNGTPTTRNIVAQDKCDSCHGKFKPETTASAQFHGGGRIAASMCNVCHNVARTSNPAADSTSFVHRIHNGPMVATANLFHGISATYPRDVRDCDACHGGAEQGAQALNNPSKSACIGCHDYVKFEQANTPYCNIGGTLARGTDGKPLECNHIADDFPDSECASCHAEGEPFATSRYHRPVAPPDPNNVWITGGTNSNTNAAYVAAGGYVPPDAEPITYEIKTVDTVLDMNANVRRPRMTFKFKRNGTDVVFNDASVATEMMNDFVGSPSAYWAFAVPQDGITAPTDFNASVSGYLRKIWNGTGVNAAAGTLTGPDGTGFYTVTLTNVQIPASAKMLTGGLGYTYNLNSAPPLVQTNVDDYPWTPNQPADGKAQGGLSVPPPNVWKVATGYTGRRAIVDNEKCKDCHGALGVTPSFHGGERNDGPTCSFCHTPNRSSAGWSAGSKFFIHAIHGGRKRTVPFTWHAASAGPGYDEIEFPGTLNTCTTCHVPGGYDFVSSSSFSALANMPVTTVASGTLDPDPMTNSRYYTVSPYIPLQAASYGSTFSYNAQTDTTTPAAATTLVTSPLTTVCAACHDTAIAITHMEQNGGSFYALRSDAVGPNAPQEQCMICHGPGRIAAIGTVHQR